MKRHYKNKLRTYCDVCRKIVPIGEEGRLFKDGDDILDVCSPKCAEREFNARYHQAFYFVSGTRHHFSPSSNTGVTISLTAENESQNGGEK